MSQQVCKLSWYLKTLRELLSFLPSPPLQPGTLSATLLFPLTLNP